MDAVWPGWGHASEYPELPDGLAKRNITFIGPSGGPMRALGDKIAASILAQTARVSSIPWSGDGITCDPKVVIETGAIPPELFRKAMVTTEEECIAAAERIGYPVMLKASEGGGGKGIRMSKDAAEFSFPFVQVTNEVPGARRRPSRRHRRDASPTRNSAIDDAAPARNNKLTLNHAQARPCSSRCAPTRDIWRCRSSVINRKQWH